jgi:16S rRNA (adenine1518-N6/adenine1519-N6)-dimethyltransferase
MQTKGEIKRLLESAGIRPNKQLGQHFLIDLNLMEVLVNCAAVEKDDVVLEVGCGTGSLTQALSQVAGWVIAVEADEGLWRIAESEAGGAANVEIFCGDILAGKSAINSAVLSAIERAREKLGGRFLLVSNLPYNAATPVMLNLVKAAKVDGMCVTVQKEVAQRMAAKEGSKDYGILSIMLAVTGDAKIERKLPPSVFWPAPAVESAMVSWVRSDEKISHIIKMDLFRETVNLFMSHRRKMLKGCVKLAVGRMKKLDNWDEIFQQCSVNPQSRPDQLSPDNYINIANLCCEQLKNRP